MRYTNCTKALRDIKETYRRGSTGSEAEVINRFVKSDLLVIDEVIAEHSISGELSKHDKYLLFEIINQRYEQMRSTIIVSNADQTHLAKQLGESTLDRILENSITLAFNWDSYRRSGLRTANLIELSVSQQ